MNRRILALATSVTMALSAAASCAKDYSAKAPEFENGGKGVTFGAWIGPYLTSGVDSLTEDHFKKFAEAGFDFAVGLNEGICWSTGDTVDETIALRREKATEDALKVMSLADKYGVKYYVRDTSFYDYGTLFTSLGEEKSKDAIYKIFDESNQYVKHSAYAGSLAFDEPTVQQMDIMVWQAKYFNEAMKKLGIEGKEVFMNLYPAFVMDNSSNLSVNCDKTYRQYVDYYFENIIEHVGYVRWDYYPLMRSAIGETYIRDTYYYNYELMAEKCKGTDYEIRTFVQANGDWTGTRNIESSRDLSWQIWSGLAFGCREYTYFNYSANGLDNYTKDWGYGLFDSSTGEYTWVYDAAKKVNNEIDVLTGVYDAYDWDGVMYKNASVEVDNQLFANLCNAMDSHENFELGKCSLDTLVGVFKAKDKNSSAKDAFMIVNSNDPLSEDTDEVNVKFKNAKALLVYGTDGKKVITLEKDGSCKLEIKSGEGCFVIPFK